jgi:hypothetical protein
MGDLKFLSRTSQDVEDENICRGRRPICRNSNLLLSNTGPSLYPNTFKLNVKYETSSTVFKTFFQ